MRVSLIAVGRLKDKAERGLADRYIERFDRVGRSIGLGPVEEIELGESRKDNVAARRAEEGAAMLSRAPYGARLVALDAGGKQLSSEDFAALMGEWRDAGTSRACFLIGGPDGQGEAVAQAADLTLSLGRMTLPHGLARIVLAEQFYRAATILAGHPYHRA
ncbi:23S rRNA (pseudouridine(1915)-N(3))-methyltransferase RlmH [Dichotomicrobium thermohalophilum]|uniref:Ribosomal RNA large subunit methyltransferase H n=1 Tax=Dichotomicrobium thermohalophilum TaxID=933063 RepID=A0A397PCN8_9HYPH|nr:23S rRNA (pseudouridine(1915)-N(3))-methyltransferase RlmH [Dichotomicrobium thermohalophilum]RIA47266.1 23S rRNA (pseudouridine1915-N3)-methyltransferase [Dichotomicrobium thermohalophilum]